MIIQKQFISVEDLIQQTNLKSEDLSPIITQLELENRIKSIGSGKCKDE